VFALCGNLGLLSNDRAFREEKRVMSKKVNVDKIFKGAKPPAQLTDADKQRIDSMFRALAGTIAQI